MALSEACAGDVSELSLNVVKGGSGPCCTDITLLLPEAGDPGRGLLLGVDKRAELRGKTGQSSRPPGEGA